MRIPKTVYSLCVVLPIMASASTGVAASDECRVFDPYDSGVNVRATPNGRKINRLRNGRIVYAEDYDNDTQGRPWAYVSGNYNGAWRNWGWMYYDLLRCS